jgi:hypothetical protein
LVEFDLSQNLEKKSKDQLHGPKADHNPVYTPPARPSTCQR